jgi:hypothetical protein
MGALLYEGTYLTTFTYGYVTERKQTILTETSLRYACVMSLACPGSIFVPLASGDVGPCARLHAASRSIGARSSASHLI